MSGEKAQRIYNMYSNLRNADAKEIALAFEDLPVEKLNTIVKLAKSYIKIKEHKEVSCYDCEDTGVTITPAYQSGGEIVDEVEQTCHCQKEHGDE